MSSWPAATVASGPHAATDANADAPAAIGDAAADGDVAMTALDWLATLRTKECQRQQACMSPPLFGLAYSSVEACVAMNTGVTGAACVGGICQAADCN